MESHFRLQNESWSHSAKRLIFFQMSETVPQLENTLPEPMCVIFSSVLLRDSSIISVRVHIKNTLAASKERLKTMGTQAGYMKMEVEQRRLPCQIPSQNYIT